MLVLLPQTVTNARAELPTPAMPELEACTDTSITLKAVTPPEGCTVDTEDNSIRAAALNITAPGVTLTSPKGYYFGAYRLAEGVVAVPSFSVYHNTDYSYFAVDKGCVYGLMLVDRGTFAPLCEPWYGWRQK